VIEFAAIHVEYPRKRPKPGVVCDWNNSTILLEEWVSRLRPGRVKGYTPGNQGTEAGRELYAGRRLSIQAVISGSAQMAEGSIKKLTDKGFGFISTGKEKDLFFHSSSVQGVSFDDLHEGQKVSFTEGRGPKGPCAENVKPV
jgi:CspA family cold shock protein